MLSWQSLSPLKQFHLDCVIGHSMLCSAYETMQFSLATPLANGQRHPLISCKEYRNSQFPDIQITVYSGDNGFMQENMPAGRVSQTSSEILSTCKNSSWFECSSRYKCSSSSEDFNSSKASQVTAKVIHSLYSLLFGAPPSTMPMLGFKTDHTRHATPYPTLYEIRYSESCTLPYLKFESRKYLAYFCVHKPLQFYSQWLSLGQGWNEGTRCRIYSMRGGCVREGQERRSRENIHSGTDRKCLEDAVDNKTAEECLERRAMVTLVPNYCSNYLSFTLLPNSHFPNFDTRGTRSMKVKTFIVRSYSRPGVNS